MSTELTFAISLGLAQTNDDDASIIYLARALTREQA